ncbi:hypothetical protein RUM44_000666 [Polyplax serrata]|uniref:Uncharacterized protein n=1 Tax=Polyplax serrata TaxID=468196 RepID=A0ABR1B8Z5_POLSC
MLSYPVKEIPDLSLDYHIEYLTLAIVLTAQEEITKMSLLSASMLHPRPPILSSPYVPSLYRTFNPSLLSYSQPVDSLSIPLSPDSPRRTRASSPLLERRKT